MAFNMSISNEERSAIAQIFLDVDPDLKPIHIFYLSRRTKWSSDIVKLQSISFSVRSKDPNGSNFNDKDFSWSLRTIKDLYSKIVSADEELITLYFQQKLSVKFNLNTLAERLVLHLLSGEPYLEIIS